MGWIADGNATWGTDALVTFASLGTTLCAMGYDADGASGWHRRTAPATWVQCVLAAGPIYGEGRGDFWRSQLWDVDFNSKLYRSSDAINWTMDKDFAADYGTRVFTEGIVGGCGTNYLIVAHWNTGTLQMEFARRTAGGVWTNNVAAAYPGLANPYSIGIIQHDGIIWWSTYSDLGSKTRRWNGVSWSDVDVFGNDLTSFIHHNGILFASNSRGIYRLRGSSWYKESSLFIGARGRLSAGSDGKLYCASGNPACIYRRQPGGYWVLVGKTATAAGRIATYHGATMYLGNPVRFFYVYTPDHNVSVSGGLYPQAMDCNGDGTQLYIAVLDSVAATPILVSVPLPLDPAAFGAAVFNPGAGDSINVKCTAVGGKLAISGLLSASGNDSVRVSKDAGATWTDVAPDWGDTAQPLLVDPDTVDDVAVALDAAQDILDTEDGGITWTQRQALVGYSPGAMARLPDGDELVVGDDAANRIDYSPNRGQTLANITGAFAGNVAALEVT